jgi:peroxiredoxin
MQDELIGTILPDITLEAALPGGGAQTVSLRSLAGKWVVIFIYPKDSTSG